MTGHHHTDNHIDDHADDADDQPIGTSPTAWPPSTTYDYDYDDYDDDDFDSGWSPELEARLTDVSWAVAARDCALEVGDRSAAAGFAEQARDAIAKAVAAGIAPAELADELDYPGGHTAMDGPHIDDEIAALRPPAQPDPPTRAARPTAVSAAAVSAAAGLAAAAAVTADGEAGDAARAGPAHPLAPRRPLRTQRRGPRRRGSRCGPLRPRPRHPPSTTSTTTGGRDGHPDPYQSRFVPSPPVDSAVVDSVVDSAVGVVGAGGDLVARTRGRPGRGGGDRARAVRGRPRRPGTGRDRLAVPADHRRARPGRLRRHRPPHRRRHPLRLVGRRPWRPGCPGSPRPATSPAAPPSTPHPLCGSASAPGPRSPPRSSRTCSTCSPPTPHPPSTTWTRTTSTSTDVDEQPVSEQLSMPCPDPVPPPSMAGRGPERVDPGGEESDPTAGRPTAVTMRGDDAEPAEPVGPRPECLPSCTGGCSTGGVQHRARTTRPVQRGRRRLAARAATADDQPSAPSPNAGDEHRSGPVEHHADAGLNTANGGRAPPRDRARAAAMRHAARHGALPTVSELEGAGRGVPRHRRSRPQALATTRPRCTSSPTPPNRRPSHDHTSPTQHPTSTHSTTDPSTTSRTTTTTKHYSRSTNASPEPRTRATRSKDSHRCITIRGCGPASGRPEPLARPADRRC